MSAETDVNVLAMLDLEVRVPPHVVFRAFPAETVMLNLDTGQYHGVNPTGGRMLDELQRTPLIRTAAGKLAKEYGLPTSDIQRDICEFCSGLVERRLIELHATPAR